MFEGVRRRWFCFCVANGFTRSVEFLLKLPLRSLMICLAIFSIAGGSLLSGETVYLDALDLSKMRQGWGKPQKNRSIRETQLSIGGIKYERGVGTHAKSVFWLDLSGGCEKFVSDIGVDDAAGGNPSVVFKIYGDGKKLWDSGLMKLGDKPQDRKSVV